MVPGACALPRRDRQLRRLTCALSIEHEPFQDYGILAVSDTFYRQEQGLNWLSSSSQSR